MVRDMLKRLSHPTQLYCSWPFPMKAFKKFSLCDKSKFRQFSESYQTFGVSILIPIETTMIVRETITKVENYRVFVYNLIFSAIC